VAGGITHSQTSSTCRGAPNSEIAVVSSSAACGIQPCPCPGVGSGITSRPACQKARSAWARARSISVTGSSVPVVATRLSIVSVGRIGAPIVDRPFTPGPRK